MKVIWLNLSDTRRFALSREINAANAYRSLPHQKYSPNYLLPPMTATQAETYTISELAREFDLTPRAIRYWEDQGLVTPSRAGVNRVYDKRERTRLLLALRGKRLGLSLAEIRELIDMYDQTDNGTLNEPAAREAAQLRRLLDVLGDRRAALEQQRADIDAVLDDLRRFERQARKTLKTLPSE
jgi:DNA-binding transcriptional MerR regulator